MEFKPKDWVLVRDDEKTRWKLDIFSHFVDRDSFPYICVGSYYDECIPYAGNEALLGTTDAPEEKKTDGWKVGDKVEVMNVCDEKWYPGEVVSVSKIDKDDHPYFVKSEEGFKGRNDGSACLWCRAKHLRKPEEKPEEEDGWRPKKGEAVEVEVRGIWRSAVLVSDDHAPDMPYRVRLDNGEIRWCSKDGVRPALRKTEEPFKFGDKVEIRMNDEWREAVVIEIDHSAIPYKVATADGDIHWRRRGDVRRA